MERIGDAVERLAARFPPRRLDPQIVMGPRRPALAGSGVDPAPECQWPLEPPRLRP